MQSIRASIWGSRRATIGKWNDEDRLVFFTDKMIAAVAEVRGKMTVSDTLVWDNGIFPYRRLVVFTHAFKKENRVPLKGAVKEALTKAYGSNYGWVFLNKPPVDTEAAEVIWSLVSSVPNNLAELKR